MNITAQLTLSSDELKNIFAEAMSPFAERIRELEIAVGTKKHAYTVREVAEQIGYSTKSVYDFIQKGRVARNGKTVCLAVKEITAGDYRILPADLDRFLSNF